MKNEILNSSSIDNSGSGYHFEQSSFISNDASNSQIVLGVDASILQRNEQDNSKIIQEIRLDEEMLEKYPVFAQETMKIFYGRTDDPVLREFCLKQREIDNKEVEKQETSERAQITKEFRSLAHKVDQLNQNGSKNMDRLQKLILEKLRIIDGLDNLKEQLKQMISDSEHNPTVKIQSQQLKQWIQKVTPKQNNQNNENNENEKKQQKVHLTNEQKIQNRLNQIQYYESLDKELKSQIEYQSQRLDEIKNQIKEAKLKRNQNIQQLENGEINLKMNIVPDEIERIVDNIYDTREMENIGRPLEEYLAEIEQLEKRKISLEAELNFQESILSEKANKSALLQKQYKEMQIELRKFKNLSQAQTEDETQGDGVNYRELILKTYELKENRKRTERLENEVLDNGADISKRAKRIVVEQQALTFTQKVFPSIKNYKQLVNWLLVLWVVVLALFFVQKTLVKNDLWFSPYYELELELSQKPVVHNVQTKHKLNEGNLVNNISQKLDQVKEDKGIGKVAYPDEEFELKRKHMEEVNAGEGIKQDDWKSKLASEFE